MTEQNLNTEGDRDAVYRQVFEAKQREFLKGLVSDEVIAEHREHPFGQHSEPLTRLLLYFSRAGQDTRYVVKRENGTGAYRIMEMKRDRQEPVESMDEEVHSTPEDAYHEVFLRRIRELMES